MMFTQSLALNDYNDSMPKIKDNNSTLPKLGYTTVRPKVPPIKYSVSAMSNNRNDERDKSIYSERSNNDQNFNPFHARKTSMNVGF